MIKCVSFDKDGTLIKFDEIWFEATKSLIERIIHKYRVPDKKSDLYDALKVTPDGVSSDSVLAYDTSVEAAEVIQSVINDDINQILHFVNDHYYRYTRNHLNKITPTTNLEALFKRLKDDGYYIAVVTADDKDVTELTFEYLGVKKYIDFLATGDTYDKKPMKEAAIACANALNIQTDEIIHIGDTATDLKFSQHLKAGVGVLSGVSCKQELIQYTDYIIEDVGAIYEILDNFSQFQEL